MVIGDPSVREGGFRSVKDKLGQGEFPGSPIRVRILTRGWIGVGLMLGTVFVMFEELRPGQSLPPIRSLGHYEFSIRSLQFIPGSSILATRDTGGRLLLWEVDRGWRLGQWGEPDLQVMSFACSADGQALALGFSDGKVLLQDRWSDRGITTIDSGSEAVLSLAFSPDGQTLALGNAGGSLEFWEVASGTRIEQEQTDWMTISALTYSNDGQWLAMAGTLPKGYAVRVRESDGISVREVRFSLQGACLISHLWMTPEKDQVIWYSRFSGRVWVWDLSDDRVTPLFGELDQGAVALTMTDDASSLVVGRSDGWVELWDRQPVRLRSRIKCPSGTIQCLAISSDCRSIAIGGTEPIVRLWEPKLPKRSGRRSPAPDRSA